ncbi:MAG: hypothetical protein ABIJ16_02635 [Bacteroidota bacterium]
MIFQISCSKFEDTRRNKLSGIWELVPMSPGNKITWEFDSDSSITKTTNDTRVKDGAYSVNIKNGEYYLEVRNLNYWEDNGTYLILKQNSDILIMQRVEAEFDGAFLRKEFIRK